MNDKYLLTSTEIKKINLVKLIEKLFLEHEVLYAINIFHYPTSIIEKGKITSVKSSTKLAIAFKHHDTYCFWFNGGATTFENKEDLFNNSLKLSTIRMLTNFKPINFYLKYNKNKLSYSDFESLILNNLKLESEVINSIIRDYPSIYFCRETLETDGMNFLGAEIRCKQNAIFLENTLPFKNNHSECVKI